MNKLVQDIEQEAKALEQFAEALWISGDKINAQFHDGRAVGMREVVKRIKGENND